MDDSRALPMFRCEHIESSKLAKEWTEWKLSLECYFDSCQIEDQKLKRSKMLHYGGPQLQKVFRSLEDTEDFPEVLLEKPWYDRAIEQLDAYFKPRRQDVLERHKLRNIKQGANERFAHFVLRLRQQLADCGFEKYPRQVRNVLEEIMLIDVIVEGCTSHELRRKILEKDQSIAEIEALGASLESVRIQEKEMNSSSSRGDGEALEIRKVQKSMRGRAERKQDRVMNRYLSGGSTNKSEQESKTVCYACGQDGHISKDPACPAKGQKCHRCRGVGHFAPVCRKRSMQPQRFHHQDKAKTVRAIESGTETKVRKEDDEGADQKVYYTFYAGNQTNNIKCRVGNVVIEMFVDSGSDANLVTAETWEMLKQNKVVVSKCTSGSKKILKAYGSDNPLHILGTFEATTAVGNRSVTAEFFVVAKGQRNLLGDVTSKQLGVLKVGLEVNQVEKNAAFSKIKGVQVHIEMDPTVVPVFQPLRRIPIALESAVNEKLEELLARDIIVEKRGPATWVSPLVVATKANGQIRLCVDLRRVNQAVIRERHPMPIIEDILGKIGRGNVWTTLDIKDAFFLLELDEESRDIVTFITHRGLYQFKRLPFGLVSAPEIFQRTMDGILADCEGAYWYLDDVGVEGSTVEEHDARLNKV